MKRSIIRGVVGGVTINVWKAPEGLVEYNVTFIRRAIVERATVHASSIDEAWEKAVAMLGGKRKPTSPNLDVVDVLRASIKQSKTKSRGESK